MYVREKYKTGEPDAGQDLREMQRGNSAAGTVFRPWNL